jgi:hypothetical protein
MEFAIGKLQGQKSPGMAIFGRARDRSGNTGGFTGGKAEELERIARSPHRGDAPNDHA